MPTEYKDYRDEPLEQIYEDAIRHTRDELPLARTILPDLPFYWVARFASRATAGAILTEAREIGISEDRLERLYRVASWVAPD